MDQQEVDAVHSEPLQTVLERAHHAVIAVVEQRLEIETADPFPRSNGPLFSGRRRTRPTLVEMTNVSRGLR